MYGYKKYAITSAYATVCSAGKRFCDLDLGTRDLENVISPWPDCE